MRRLTKRKRIARFRLCLSAALLLLPILITGLYGWGRVAEEIPVVSLLAPAIDRTYLVIGRDRAGNNTDVMLVARLDGDSNRAAVMQIPRDTYVGDRYGGYKLNAYYHVCLQAALEEGETHPTQAALTRMTADFSDSLGIDFDGYVMLDLDTFCQIVDAVGGVTVEIPCDLSYEDPEQGLCISLPKGKRHLNGAEAEQFVRFRSDYIRADLGRVDAQKLFLSALFARLKEGLSPGELLDVGEMVLRYTTTSVTVSDLPLLAVNGLRLELSSVYFFTAPGEVTANGRYYVLNAEGMTRCLNAFYTVTGPFDPDLRFRGFNSGEIRALYAAPYREELFPYTAEELIRNGIDIATRHPH